MIVFHSRNDVLLRTRDGRNCEIAERIVLMTGTGEVYSVPPGALTDGPSTPPIVWQRLPPFGIYWLAAVVHDAAYRNTLERQTVDGLWLPANLNKDQCDTLFLDCMTALGVPQGIKEELYEGVHLFGWRSFRDDRTSA
jgi:hypothetical protein